jgi:hypothetical protein
MAVDPEAHGSCRLGWRIMGAVGDGLHLGRYSTVRFAASVECSVSFVYCPAGSSVIAQQS